MPGFAQAILKSGLTALYLTGAHRLAAARRGAAGAILMLHHVRPWQGDGFAPNRHLEVTPAFLDAALARIRASGFDLVSLDEAISRIVEPGRGGPFAAVTLDDGYRDNAEFAVPIFRRHDCPYAIYVASDFAEQRGVLWWLVLEQALRRLDHIEIRVGGSARRLPLTDAAAKTAAFGTIYQAMLAEGEPSRGSLVVDVARQAGFDVTEPCRRLCMDWQELAAVGADPLATIGSHTRSHPVLSKLSAAEAAADMRIGRDEAVRRLQRPVEHFCYPVGNRASAGHREFVLAGEIGFRSAVTTRRGLVFADHQAHLTSLPRVSLNGHFQTMRYLDMFLSGLPFALANRGRRVDAA